MLVVGQMLMFFGELGFMFPQFPFIAHSRGWHAEDMENNVLYVQKVTGSKKGLALWLIAPLNLHKR